MKRFKQQLALLAICLTFIPLSFLNAQTEVKGVDEIAASYQSGEWNYYVTYPVGRNDKKFVIKRRYPVEITTENGKVTQLKIEGDVMKLKTSESSVPNYWWNGTKRVFPLDGGFYVFNPKGDDPCYYWEYAYFPKGTKPAKKASEIKPRIQEYFANCKKAQSEAYEKAREESAAADKAARAANSIKGKEVSSLELVINKMPTQIGHTTKLDFGIVAKLADGKEIKTNNIGGEGFWDDYTFEVQGGFMASKLSLTNDSYQYDIDILGENWTGGTVCVSRDARDIKGDKVTVTVKSNHHNGLTATKSVDVKYNTPIKMDYWGQKGLWNHNDKGPSGKNGRDLKFEVCNAKTSNGTAVHHIRISDLNSTEVLRTLKVVPGTNIHVNGKGGKGGTGKYYGGDGGRGSNIKVVKDPAVKNFNFDAVLTGGRGASGSGGNGSNGADGKITEETRSMSF